MCGRYGRRGDKQKIAEAFSAGIPEDVDFEASEDVAPGSIQPVVSLDEEGHRSLRMMRWGFKLPDRLLFNTRSEGVDRANFWKKMFAEHRCIVPASTFYEWEKVKGGTKPKFEFAVPGREYMGLAAVWSRWKNPKADTWEPTFSILTNEANGVMRPIHDRQPTILQLRDYGEWLADTERPPVHLLRILPDDEMAAVLVNPESRAAVPEPTERGLFDLL